MTGRVKGCLNKNCSEYHKRFFKASEANCDVCGEPLFFVCKNKNCFKQLPNDCKDKYCALHIAERNDNKINNEKSSQSILASLSQSLLPAVV